MSWKLPLLQFLRWSFAGEIGWSNMAPTDGNSTYRNRIIDAIYQMDAETLNRGAKYELR